mgnify:CR=1 FL=1
MDKIRAETAVEERTRRMLNVARKDVSVTCWDGSDGLRSTCVHLRVPLTGRKTETVHRWVAYLDGFAIGHVRVWTIGLQSDITIPTK